MRTIIQNIFLITLFAVGLFACNDSTTTSTTGTSVTVPASVQNQYTLKYSGEDVDGLVDSTLYTVIIGSDSSLTIDPNPPLTDPTEEDFYETGTTQITWTNGDYAYVLSTLSDGSFNEINVLDTKNLTNNYPTFKGQFAEDTNVNGTAAVGKALVGAEVTAKCADGSGFIYSVTTRNDGSWSGKVSETSFPCAFSVTDGTQGITLTSYGMTEGVVNITPLSHLAIAIATGKNPDQWFSGTDIGIVENTFNSAIDDLKAALITAGFTLPDGSFLTEKLSIGDLWDKVLDDLAASIAASTEYNSFDQLVAAFKDGNTTIPTYTASETSGSGSYDLTITISVNGSSNEVVIEDIAKPESEEQFCSVENYSYFQEGQDSADYSWAVNSCSFSGSEGNINATLDYNYEGTVFSYTYDINYLYTAN
ncbi:hypothetical protein [Thiomicrorhabdus heinhorstiae]|uniref:Lipoprotein n=1 Tax=Thiomicrorhabdus heinhorstiae TaxID=2748010 RepID=A0ABS0C3R9_9GAMM|nr:hypothetical protein [Thiomicrorhabdus heinhorstiae]MBF6058907.1 hypothetical protein [Thiomicrorhabdus heinhorstiae]